MVYDTSEIDQKTEKLKQMQEVMVQKLKELKQVKQEADESLSKQNEKEIEELKGIVSQEGEPNPQTPIKKLKKPSLPTISEKEDFEIINTIKFVIHSEQQTDPEFYADYEAKLDIPKGQLISNMDLTDYEFPKLKFEIRELSFSLSGEKSGKLLIPAGNYTYDEYMKQLVEGFEAVDIELQINPSNGLIRLTSNSEFKINYEESNLAAFLGFTKTVSGKECITENPLRLYTDNKLILFVNGNEFTTFDFNDEIDDIMHSKQFDKPIDINPLYLKFTSPSFNDLKSKFFYKNQEIFNFDNQPHILMFKCLNAN